MRIGIDMRMAGTGEGISRYVEKLVENLADLDQQNDYLLLCAASSAFANNFSVPNPRFQKILIRSPYYSWAEQTKFIAELTRLHLDLVHFANFNAPIFYPGRFVTTIHDIIHHLYPGEKKSRFYHRLAYRWAIRSAVSHAAKIITVSQSTKTDIVKTFHVAPQKVAVIYEGVDQSFSRAVDEAQFARTKTKYGISKPYLLFVGVWRRYKNLPRLAAAFDILKEQYHQDCQLVLVGKVDPFYPDIRTAVFRARNRGDIKAVGFVPDVDLVALYHGARAFVLPSFVEGFGLIAVEAGAAGVPIAASDIPVLREILGAAAEYFDPLNPADIARAINEVLTDGTLVARLVAAGKQNVKKYRWADTARSTLRIYQKIIWKQKT